MSFTVVVMPRAKRLADHHAAWWRSNRPEASLFDDDFERVLASLTEHPDRGLSVGQGRRSLVTAHTGHRVVYKVRPRARRVEVVWIRSP